jgi:folate-dependent phosphoribosylglycinamide formyltransferase PurN
VVVLAPFVNSPFSRSVSALCHQEPGVELAGIICRRVLNPSRLRSELRRDGIRLVRKAWRKLVLAEADATGGDEEGLHEIAAQAGVGDQTLKAFARKEGIPFISVGDHNDPEAVSALRSMDPDVVAFTGGGIIRKGLIEAAGRGIFNTHMGPLPEYRGMDVVEWPILERRHDEPGLAVTLHFMDRGIDTGPIARIERVPIRAGDSMERLRKRFEPVMVRLMIEGIRLVRDDALDLQVQTEPEGRQYFIMHPRLYEEARRRLGKIAARS